jgi:hypothetical protein
MIDPVITPLAKKRIALVQTNEDWPKFGPVFVQSSTPVPNGESRSLFRAQGYHFPALDLCHPQMTVTTRPSPILSARPVAAPFTASGGHSGGHHLRGAARMLLINKEDEHISQICDISQKAIEVEHTGEITSVSVPTRHRRLLNNSAFTAHSTALCGMVGGTMIGALHYLVSNC